MISDIIRCCCFDVVMLPKIEAWISPFLHFLGRNDKDLFKKLRDTKICCCREGKRGAYQKICNMILSSDWQGKLLMNISFSFLLNSAVRPFHVSQVCVNLFTLFQSDLESLPFIDLELGSLIVKVM